MKPGKLQRKVFAVSILFHSVLLLPLAARRDHEPEPVTTHITFTALTAETGKTDSKPESAKKNETRECRPETAPAKKKKKYSPDRRVGIPEKSAPPSSDDSPPVTRQESAAATASSGPPQATPAPQSGRYLSIVRSRIQEKKHYPPFARDMRQEGGAVVRITIGPEGEVRTSSLVRSSGYTLLDKAAIEAVRRAQPFPPPAEYGLGPLSIDVPIHYRIL